VIVPQLMDTDENNESTTLNTETECDQIDDPLENFILSQSRTNLLISSPEDHSIRLLLEEFDNVPRIHHKQDIRKYWLDNKNNKPELFLLAQITMAVPCTQVINNYSFILAF